MHNVINVFPKFKNTMQITKLHTLRCAKVVQPPEQSNIALFLGYPDYELIYNFAIS
jgi:hypothetical protein